MTKRQLSAPPLGDLPNKRQCLDPSAGAFTEEDQVQVLKDRLKKLDGELSHAQSVNKSQATLVNSLSNNLSCRICLGILDSPHALQCGHMFCYKDLFKHFHCLDSSPTPGLFSGSHPIRKNLTCPLCRAPVTSPPFVIYEVKAAADTLRATDSDPDALTPSTREEDKTWGNIFSNDQSLRRGGMMQDGVNGAGRCTNGASCQIRGDGICDVCGLRYPGRNRSDDNDEDVRHPRASNARDAFIQGTRALLREVEENGGRLEILYGSGGLDGLFGREEQSAGSDTSDLANFGSSPLDDHES